MAVCRRSQNSTADDRLCRNNNVVYHTMPKAVSLESIKAETKRDRTLQSAAARRDRRQAANDKQTTDTRSYYNVRPEQTANVEQDIILRGSRLCILTPLQSHWIEIAHSGHQGQVVLYTSMLVYRTRLVNALWRRKAY